MKLSVKSIVVLCIVASLIGCSKQDKQDISQSKGRIADIVKVATSGNGKDVLTNFLQEIQNGNKNGALLLMHNKNMEGVNKVCKERFAHLPDYKRDSEISKCIESSKTSDYRKVCETFISSNFLPKSARFSIIETKPDPEDKLSFIHFVKVTYSNKEESYYNCKECVFTMWYTNVDRSFDDILGGDVGKPDVLSSF